MATGRSLSSSDSALVAPPRAATHRDTAAVQEAQRLEQLQQQEALAQIGAQAWRVRVQHMPGEAQRTTERVRVVLIPAGFVESVGVVGWLVRS